MGTDNLPPIKRGHVVFVGSKASGKSSLYQCLKSPNLQVADGPSCSVLVEDWRPLSSESPVADECKKYFNQNLSEEDLNASLCVWDICGHEALWTIQQLCIPEKTLFVLVFNVRSPKNASLLSMWVQVIQSKSPGAKIIISGSNSEVSDEDCCQSILDSINNMENRVLDEINEELFGLREIKFNTWVKNRIEKLECIIKKRPDVCSTVYLTSAVTGKGLSDLRRAILTHFFDVEKSSNVYTFNEKETNLVKRLRPLHDGKGIVMLGKDYKALTSDIGIHGDKALESTTQALQSKGLISRVNIAGTFDDPDNTIIITDPCCFANACAMLHRDENPQDFVNKLQKSSLLQRFWPTSTRPNDWTLRSAVEDVVNRGLIRESFFPLCWQVWNTNEEDVEQLLRAMLKLGVVIDGAPKAGYEIELALSYFKNLSVTRRYHLPLLMKLPAKPPEEAWQKVAPSSTVKVSWLFKFQEGFCEDLTQYILAISKNIYATKGILSHWQNGLVVRVGDVDVLIVSKSGVYELTARCRVTRGNKQALNMAWASLALFIYIAERFLSNFPGLYYTFGSPSIVDSRSRRSVNHVLSELLTSTENSSEKLWLVPPIHFHETDDVAFPSDLETWMQRVSDQRNLCIVYNEGYKEEARGLGTNLEKSGFEIYLQSSVLTPSDQEFGVVQRCAAIIILLTKSYIEDQKFEETVKEFESLNKPLIGACFEETLSCSLPNVTDLSAGSGSGTEHTFDANQIQTLVTNCRNLIFSTGDIAPLSIAAGDPVPLATRNFESVEMSGSVEPASETSRAVFHMPAMEGGQKKHKVTFKNDHMKNPNDHVNLKNGHVTAEDDQIKPLASCTVAAAVVGATAEHLKLSREATSAGAQAADATAKVARAVAHGDSGAATAALSDVISIVDDLANSIKQNESNREPAAKSKTCVIL